MKKMMKKVMATILAISMLMGLTGCIGVTEILDLRKNGKYSYSMAVKMNLAFMKDMMGEEYDEEVVKETYKEEYKGKSSKVSFEKDEEDNLWVVVKNKAKNLNKKEVKKMYTVPGVMTEYLGLEVDEDIEEAEELNTRYIFNKKKFVLEQEGSQAFSEEDLLDMVEDTEETEAEATVQEDASSEETSDAETIAELIEGIEITYSLTARFPYHVEKTNGRVKKDGKTVVWNDVASGKMYAFFE